MKHRPARPSGNSHEARFMQWVYDTLISLDPKGGKGVKVEHNSNGFIISVKESEESSTASDDGVWL